MVFHPFRRGQRHGQARAPRALPARNAHVPAMRIIGKQKIKWNGFSIFSLDEIFFAIRNDFAYSVS
jgi:hypothetical protein